MTCDTNNTAEQQCVGTGLNDADWMARWNNNFCFTTFSNILFDLDGERKYNANKLNCLQQDFNTIFTRYTDTYTITSPGQVGYNAFQETLQNTCANLPGVCNDAMLNIVCTGESRDSIANNGGVLSFCGCFAPPELNSPCIQVQRADRYRCREQEPDGCIPQCDPLCTREKVIRLGNGNGDFCRCNSNVCAINNVTIDATNSSVGGSNFNQVCNDCGQDGCVCVISGVNIATVGNSVGLSSSNFNQNCGEQSRCIQINNDGGQTEVDCQDALAKIITPVENVNPTDIAGLPIAFWIFAALALIVAIIVFIYAVNSKN